MASKAEVEVAQATEALPTQRLRRRRSAPGADMKKSKSRLIQGPTAHLFRWRQLVLSVDGPADFKMDGHLVKASTQRLVACALASYMDASGGSCFPSLDTLADATKLARSSVVLAVRALEAQGWIHRLRGGGATHSTRYQALIPAAILDQVRV